MQYVGTLSWGMAAPAVRQTFGRAKVLKAGTAPAAQESEACRLEEAGADFPGLRGAMRPPGRDRGHCAAGGRDAQRWRSTRGGRR